MLNWLGKAGLGGFRNYVWIVGIGLLLAAIAGAVIIADNFVEDAFDSTEQLGREAGEVGAVIAGQEATLDQLGDANDVEQDLRAGGERSAERYAGCLRNSRRPGACERYRPFEE